MLYYTSTLLYARMMIDKQWNQKRMTHGNEISAIADNVFHVVSYAGRSVDCAQYILKHFNLLPLARDMRKNRLRDMHPIRSKFRLIQLCFNLSAHRH